MKKILLLTLVLLLSLTLVACGGGGGNDREPIFSTNMVDVAAAGVEVSFSEDMSYIIHEARLILTFSEDTSPTTGSVLNRPITGIDLSRDFFEDVTSRMDRTIQGSVEEITVNGSAAFMQRFEDYFVFVMFSGNSGVYGINFSTEADAFDRYFPYFLDLLDSIRDGDNNLVGSWVRNDDPNVSYLFRADGTGVFDIGIAALQFTWTTGVGTFTIDGDGVFDEISFFIDGDTLTTVGSNGNLQFFTRVTDAEEPAPVEEPEEEEELEEEIEEEEELEEEPEEAEEEPTPAAAGLEGTWLWMGSAYYVFESGGRGTMMGEDIRWTSRAGILSICTTPAVCGNSCIAPMEWHYTLNGNNLNLVSTLMPELDFDYTRR